MVAKRIRFYYGIFLSVLTAVLGALFIAQAVTILADGDWVQGAYSREIVAEHLFPVSIVLYVWIAAIVAGFVLSLIFPYNEKQVKPTAVGKLCIGSHLVYPRVAERNTKPI